MRCVYVCVCGVCVCVCVGPSEFMPMKVILFQTALYTCTCSHSYITIV